MNKHLMLLVAVALAGCEQDGQQKPPIKTSYSEIQKNFSANGAKADALYKGRSVQLTDTINSIKTGGTVVLVSDSMESYIVNISSDYRSLLEKLSPGDKLTIKCSSVDSSMLSMCAVVH